MTRSSATFEVVKSEEEWRRLLTPEQYSVLREQIGEHTSELQSR